MDKTTKNQIGEDILFSPDAAEEFRIRNDEKAEYDKQSPEPAADQPAGPRMHIQIPVAHINALLKGLSLATPFALAYSAESVGTVSCRIGVPKLQLMTERGESFFLITLPVINGRIEDAAKKSDVFSRKYIKYRINAAAVSLSGKVIVAGESERYWILKLLWEEAGWIITTNIDSPLQKTLMQLLSSYVNQLSGKELLRLDIADETWKSIVPLQYMLSLNTVFVWEPDSGKYLTAKVYDQNQKIDYNPIPYNPSQPIALYTQYIFHLIGKKIVAFFHNTNEFDIYFRVGPNSLQMVDGRQFQYVVNFLGDHSVYIDRISLSFDAPDTLFLDFHARVETTPGVFCSLYIEEHVQFIPHIVNTYGSQRVEFDVTFHRHVRAYDNCTKRVEKKANNTVQEFEGQLKEILPSFNFTWMYNHLLEWVKISFPSNNDHALTVNYRFGGESQPEI